MTVGVKVQCANMVATWHVRIDIIQVFGVTYKFYDRVPTCSKWQVGIIYSGVLQPRKWENCLTLDKYDWGFRKTAKIQDYLTPHEMITILVETVACGGNFLINVGPTKEGLIVPIQQERLLQLGQWLDINGEAIYETVPWKIQKDTLTPGVW